MDGKHTPVTVLEFPQNNVVQLKTLEKEGYNAIQIGVGSRRGTKALAGHAKKYSNSEKAYLHIAEFKADNFDNEKKSIIVTDFEIGDSLKITGNTIGRGFTGAVKRHGFRGQPASHGHDHVRAVGSIGCRWPQRVTPGTRMAGRSGNEQRTLNSKIVAIDSEKQLIFVAGSVPGANTKYIKIQKVNG